MSNETRCFFDAMRSYMETRSRHIQCYEVMHLSDCTKISRPRHSLFLSFFLSLSCDQRNLVALYRAMRLRFGYGFESCDANGPRNVKNTNIAKHRPIFLPPLLLVGSKELVLKVPKRGPFHAAIRVTRKRCDSCAQVALGTRTVSRRNF